MQIKKSTIKNKLLKSAKEEFLEKGFEKASIRQIVKNADTTIGNFYNYFKSKEDVFSALVDKTHKSIMRFIQTHKAEDEDPFLLDSLNPVQARTMVYGMLNIFTQDFIENLILLSDCSQGTRFESTREQLACFIELHFIEHKNLINPDYKDNEIGKVLSEQFLAGMLSVLKMDAHVSKKAELITDYLLFYVYGMLNLLKTGK